jgi:hypothetical protein
MATSEQNCDRWKSLHGQCQLQPDLAAGASIDRGNRYISEIHLCNGAVEQEIANSTIFLTPRRGNQAHQYCATKIFSGLQPPQTQRYSSSMSHQKIN